MNFENKIVKWWGFISICGAIVNLGSVYQLGIKVFLFLFCFSLFSVIIFFCFVFFSARHKVNYNFVDVNLYYFVPEVKMDYKVFSLNLCVL